MASSPGLTGQQRSFDDLGTPLAEVTFCVLDLETTGGAPERDEITEVGAVLLRGGACLGTFQTLVDPGRVIPPFISVLTGITDVMVHRAPRIDAVLPSLLEFIGGAVVVGHNVRFDLGFLRRALERSGRPALTNRSLDTAALARRLVDETPDHKLGTLADRLRLDHRPSHRALDDALATGDLLHVLIERATSLGVTGLDDLLTLPTISGHAQAGKLALTEGLPRSPGVYLFRDRRGEILYVGKATNLRQRVRSYFSGDRRRKIGQLLRETVSIEHHPYPTAFEAGVHELRLIRANRPRYNRQGKAPATCYVKLTAERFPRLSIARTVRDDGGLYLGPLGSRRTAARVVEAIETAVPLRRCTQRPGSHPRSGPCAPAQLGVATCPCAGAISELDYAALCQRVRRGLTTDPDLLLAPLVARMQTLADVQRYEEAADVRDRAQALGAALARQRRLDALRRAGRLVLDLGAGLLCDVVDGRFGQVWHVDDQPQLELGRPGPAGPDPAGLDAPVLGDLGDDRAPGIPPSPAEADEMLYLARALEAGAGTRLRLVSCSGTYATPLPRLPELRPADARPPT